jgi:glutamine synthetase
MSLVAPYVNSATVAWCPTPRPGELHWGCDNRTVGMRVPSSSPANRRVENRVIGADANPYVAMAMTLACGYLGMIQQLECSKPEMTGNAYLSREGLPGSLSEAVRLLAANAPNCTTCWGVDFCGIYRASEAVRACRVHAAISPWEREHLLLHV